MTRWDYMSKAEQHIERANKYIETYVQKGGEMPLELARHHREMAHTFANLARAAAS